MGVSLLLRDAHNVTEFDCCRGPPYPLPTNIWSVGLSRLHVRVPWTDCSGTCWANVVNWYLFQASLSTNLYDDVEGLRHSCKWKLVLVPFYGLVKLCDGMNICDAALIIHGRRSCSESDHPKSCKNDAGPRDDHGPEAVLAYVCTLDRMPADS